MLDGYRNNFAEKAVMNCKDTICSKKVMAKSGVAATAKSAQPAGTVGQP